MNDGRQLLMELVELDVRLAYNPKVTTKDRDLINRVINFLNHLQMVNILDILDSEKETEPALGKEKPK